MVMSVDDSLSLHYTLMPATQQCKVQLSHHWLSKMTETQAMSQATLHHTNAEEPLHATFPIKGTIRWGILQQKLMNFTTETHDF